MNEEMKQENGELDQETLEQVTGGMELRKKRLPSGASTWEYPKNCPTCGNALVWFRGSKKTTCINCYTTVEAVEVNHTVNPNA